MPSLSQTKSPSEGRWGRALLVIVSCVSVAVFWTAGLRTTGYAGEPTSWTQTPNLGNGGGGFQEDDSFDDLLRSLESDGGEAAEGGAEAPAEEGDSLDDLLDSLPEMSEPEAPAEDVVPPVEIPQPRRSAERPPAPRAPARGGLGRPNPAPAPAARRAPPSDARLLQDLGVSQKIRREESDALVDLARKLMQNNELLKAEGRLEQALQLNPQNSDAQLLLSEVRLLLGDTSGEVEAILRDVRETVTVERDEAAAEIRRMIQDGLRLREDAKYDEAIEEFERAIESIRNFPFNLNLESDLRMAQSLLETTQKEKNVADEEERQAFQKIVNENRLREMQEDLRYVENQIRTLQRKAEMAVKEGRWDRAVELYERILQIKPTDEEIRRTLAEVKQQRHREVMREYIQKSIDNYELAVVGIEESSVVYQQIFRYPDAREWLRLAPKTTSIEDEIAAAESPIEKEIRRKLDDPYEIGFEEGVPLKDALSALQSISGVNFVLNKDGADAAETTVTLPRLPDLPLRSVLNLLLEAAGEEFTYAIKEGAVVIGPKTSLRKQEYLRFYEITDLTRRPPDFPAPPVALNELQGKDSAAAAIPLDMGMDAPTVGPLERDMLLQIIRKTLGEGEEEAEGISMMTGKLAARTTLENHLKLARLLEQFRSQSGMMVTIESRFLDIQDNFLEEIGVDIGSANSTFLPNSIPDIDGAGTSLAPGYEYISPDGNLNTRVASIGNLSQPLGTKVNPFNLSSSGGGAFQLNVLRAERYQIEAILTSVAKEQEIRRLNSPRVTAFNGQVAHTLVVNQAAYIQDLEVNQTGVIPVINPVIDVLNSGSILEVRPTIGYDRKYVVLEIQPTLAEQLDSDIAILNLSGNFTVVPVELPVLSVTKIKTTVTVPDGGTVLVGGLKREIANNMQIGIPGFLDIPILNLLAGRKGISQLRSNLFVLINAKITIVREEEARLFGT